MKKEIYLDYHATTPVLPEVLEAMSPYFCDHFGNANSNHAWGWKAQMAMAKASKQVADLVGSKASQVYFTSGATESIHWCLIGWTQKNPGGLILTTETEHKATYGACDWAKSLGAEVKILPVTEYGQIQVEALKNELGQDRPTLLSIIHGNNEIGTLNPIKELTELIHQYENSYIHVDAAQSVGKLPINFKELDVDFLSFSGHKLYAPKGIGAIVIKEKDSLNPLFVGGGQQRGMRAGTSNIPSIVGLGVACQWCRENMDEEYERLKGLRDTMIKKLISTGRVKLNGHPTERLPYNVNFTFEGITLDQLMLKMPKVAFSSSSACSSDSGAPSHVLKAIGLTNEEAGRSVRFGIGHGTTNEEIQYIHDQILKLFSETESFLS